MKLLKYILLLVVVLAGLDKIYSSGTRDWMDP